MDKKTYRGFPSKEAYVIWKAFCMDGSPEIAVELVKALEPDKFKEKDGGMQL